MLAAPLLLCALPAQEPATLPEDVELVQTIELVREPFPMVRLSALARGAESGETSFSIQTEWGGQRECWREVHGERVRNAEGEPLALVRAEPWQWRVRHEPGETLHLTYYLVPTRRIVDHDSNYRPIVDEGRVHLIGNTSFVLPEHLDGEEERAIELRWQGFAEAGWPVACSFGTESVLRFESTFDDFRHSVFLSSAQLELREREVQGQRVVTALSEEAWEFTPDELADAVARIVGHERDFFRDHEFPYFLVTAIPVGEASERGLSLGGTGLTDAFALFLQPGMTLAPGTSHRQRLMHLLAHEYFHTWNGRVIDREQPEELVYWISEGFTDYYTRRILLRSGLITPEEYLELVNESLARYAQNDARHEPNERIRRDFWNDPDVERLPYQRGAIVAMLCDHEIRATSEGGRSLDDLMLELADCARTRDEKISTPGLLATIAAYTSDAFAEEVRAVVEDGAEPPPLPPRLDPDLQLELELVRSYRFDMGFDFDAAQEAGAVVGVRADSVAHAAGLRDGQELRGWSVHGGDVDREIELRVEDAGGARTIRYLPRGEELVIPRYSLKPKESE